MSLEIYSSGLHGFFLLFLGGILLLDQYLMIPAIFHEVKKKLNFKTSQPLSTFSMFHSVLCFSNWVFHDECSNCDVDF